MALLSKKGGREGSIESQQKFDFFCYDIMPNKPIIRFGEVIFFNSVSLNLGVENAVFPSPPTAVKKRVKTFWNNFTPIVQGF